MSEPIFVEGIVKRTRFRRSRMEADERQKIVSRVLEFAEEDINDRAEDKDRRLQRYAKYRGWVEGKSEPWEGSSDVALPDITEAVIGLQDTLSNAILASRPVVNANATNERNHEKEDSIDRVLDYQFFLEQEGEKIIEELAELFLVDGKFTAYVPWVRERRQVTAIRIFDEIPRDQMPADVFEEKLAEEFPGGAIFPDGDSDWDYRIQLKDPTFDDAHVSFYTRESDNKLEMIIKQEVAVFDGPRVLVKDYDDVLVPPRAANLQAPSPSNPGGAPHVILVDYPTMDEIEGLKRSGYYDLAKSAKKDDELGLRSRDTSHDESKQQLDVMQGVQDDVNPKDPLHRTLTRYQCFDVYDLDGDGIAEDVIFWVLKEDKTLLKAMPLTEMFPSDPPRRPLAEASFLPVKGRHEGISMPELMEGMHDFLKEVLDTGMDGGTLANSPFFFYRPSSTLKPEIIRPWPGDGIPVGDPVRDIHFPQIPFDGSFSLNAFAVGRQMEERLTLQGDLQAGRVPQGKSSALRTVGGINTILSQGEARPERILRRFFMGFAQIFKIMHSLNQHFFPDEKQIRVLGLAEPGENPYPTIVRQADLDGTFVWDFRASILNSSKAAKQQGLEQLMGMVINPLMIQMGIVGPDEIFRMATDFAKATATDPERYLKPPTPGADQPRISANEAIATIFDHLMPDGVPAEPSAEDHLKQLQAFMQDEKFGFYDATQLELFRIWLVQIAQLAQQEQGNREIASLTAGFQEKQNAQAGANGAPPPADTGAAPLQQNELSDESLPGAQGKVG